MLNKTINKIDMINNVYQRKKINNKINKVLILRIKKKIKWKQNSKINNINKK